MIKYKDVRHFELVTAYNLLLTTYYLPLAASY